jgi:hypothetical protein
MMTTEPTREDYPIDPEREKTFSADEVFEGVRESFSDPEFEIYEGLKITVSRRAGKNASKGFSTDADKAKIFCPGSLNDDLRRASQIIEAVVKATVTCILHNANTSMSKTQTRKSNVYAHRQNTLVSEIITFVAMIGLESDDTHDALENLEASFNEFMIRDDATDVNRLGDSLNGIVQLVHKLNSQFYPEIIQ